MAASVPAWLPLNDWTHMITADELASLRKGGADDDDILSSYREYDPDTASDIDGLLKDGHKPSDILNNLVNYFNQGHETSAAPAASAPEPSALEKATGAMQFGLANLAEGPARTAKAIGYGKAAGLLHSTAQEVAPEGYDAAGSHFDLTDPSTWSYAPRAVLESSPGLAADLGAGAAAGAAGGALGGPVGAAIGGLGGFGASYVARNYGPNLDARMANQKAGAEPTAEDKAWAAGDTAVGAALSRLGVKVPLEGVVQGAGAKALKYLAGQVAKSAGAEAASGAAQDAVDQVARTADTDAGLSFDPHEVANAAGIAGATGAALRTTRSGGDVVNATRFRDVDPEAASRVVSRFDGLDVQPTNPKQAYTAVNQVRMTLDNEIADQSRIVRPMLKSEGGDADTDASRVLLSNARTMLSRGEVIPEGHFEALGIAIGGTQEGSRLVRLLQDRQAFNHLISKGTVRAPDGENSSGSFAGGIADTTLGRNVLDPRSLYRTTSGRLVSAGGGLAALAMVPGVVTTAPVIAKAQLASYLAARGADRALGLRNPAQEFTTRFRGLPQGESGGDLPSFRQQEVDSRVAAANERRQQQEVTRAAQKASEVPSVPLGGMGSQSAPEGSSRAAMGSDVPATPISVTVGNQTVQRPREGVFNLTAYVAKTRQRMQVRQAFRDDLVEAIGKDHADLADAILTRLNTGSRTWDDARGHVEDLLNDLPDVSSIDKGLDVLTAHQLKVRGTY